MNNVLFTLCSTSLPIVTVSALWITSCLHQFKLAIFVCTRGDGMATSPWEPSFMAAEQVMVLSDTQYSIDRKKVFSRNVTCLHDIAVINSKSYGRLFSTVFLFLARELTVVCSNFEFGALHPCLINRPWEKNVVCCCCFHITHNYRCILGDPGVNSPGCLLSDPKILTRLSHLVLEDAIRWDKI